MKRHVVASAIVLMAGVMCGALGAQVSKTAPRPNPNLTAPGPRRANPPGGRQVMTGTIYGFVYWDTRVTSHLSPSICSALAVTVGVAGTKPFPSYTPIGTQSHFTPIATVHPPLTSINTASYDGCAYSFNNVPLGQAFQVKLSLTQTVGMLTPAAVAQDPPVAPVQFNSGPCSKLPPLTKATVADLIGKWGSCQNVAYDVNFPLVHLQTLHPLSAGSGSGGSPSGSAPPGGMLSGRTQQGMLSSARQQGMLTTASTPGMLNGGSQPPPGQSGGPTNPGGKVMLNPQPLPPKQILTNADVINMARGGVPASAIIHSIQSANSRFDFSPAGCRALQAAHVSRQILDAMGDGSVRPCMTGGTGGAAGNLNPQPLPPRSHIALGSANPFMSQGTKAAVKLGPKLRNLNVSANGLPEVDYLNWQLFAGTEGWEDYMSQYDLSIWVVGPRGVNNPWPSNIH